MTDNDVVATCLCGKIEVIHKNGYHECDVEDLQRLGTIAAKACEEDYRHPFSARLVLVTGAVFVLLLAPVYYFNAPKSAATSVAVRDRRNEVVMLLNRAFSSYSRLDYVTAMADVHSALEIDPENEFALKAERIIMDGADTDCHVSTHPSSE